MTPQKDCQWLYLQDKKGIIHIKQSWSLNRIFFFFYKRIMVIVSFDAYRFSGVETFFYCFLVSPGLYCWSRCVSICKTNKVKKCPSWLPAWLCVSGFIARPLNLTNNPLGALPLSKLAIRLLTTCTTLDWCWHYTTIVHLVLYLSRIKDRPHRNIKL